MYSTPKPRPTRPRGKSSPILFVLGSATVIASCALGPPASDIAAPRLEQPSFTRQPCPVTSTAVASLADLESRDRARGLDTLECDARRALAVQISDEEHRLEIEALKRQAARERWTCRALGWRCP